MDGLQCYKCPFSSCHRVSFSLKEIAVHYGNCGHNYECQEGSSKSPALKAKTFNSAELQPASSVSRKSRSIGVGTPSTGLNRSGSIRETRSKRRSVPENSKDKRNPGSSSGTDIDDACKQASVGRVRTAKSLKKENEYLQFVHGCTSCTRVFRTKSEFVQHKTRVHRQLPGHKRKRIHDCSESLLTHLQIKRMKLELERVDPEIGQNTY